MPPLLLPKTIRTARLDEIPANDAETAALIAAGEAANIVPGYKLTPNPDGEKFAFYAEINVDVDNLWNLFVNLLLQMPEEIAFLYSETEEDTRFSPYMEKLALLNTIRPFELELTADGFLEYGVIYNDDEVLEEVFVTATKYIRYWGSAEARFRETMHSFSLYEMPDLQFIDEFPRVTEPIDVHFPGARPAWQLIPMLEEQFPEDEQDA